MKKQIHYLLLVFCLIMTKSMYAQDNSSLAQNAYLKAEEQFNNKDYGHALNQISQAEVYLGKTNSKILYLKIKILNAQFSSSSKPYTPLTNALSQFFSITDKNNYPKEKYLEILRLQSDLVEFKRKDSIASQNLLANGTLFSLSAYIDNTPNSLYRFQLESKRSQKQAEADMANTIAHQNEVNNRIAELNNNLIPKAKRKNISHKILGSLLVVGGGVGIYYMTTFDKKADNSSFGDNSNTYLAYAVGIPSVGAELLGFLMLFSNGDLRSFKKEKNNLMNEKKTWGLSLKPYYNNIMKKGAFGLTCKVCF